ncbi:MAG: hypothetical protein WBF53_14345 [Litorimonas sp.]
MDQDTDRLSEAAALAAATSEPVAWQPPAADGYPAPTSFNPRQPNLAATAPAYPVSPQPASPYPDPYASDPYATIPVGYAEPAYHDAGAYAASAQGHTPVSPAVWGAVPVATPPVEETSAKLSLLSRFKRKPKADETTKTKKRAISPTPPPIPEAVAPPSGPASGRKPFMMGLLTGIALMLGVGFIMGGDAPSVTTYSEPVMETEPPADAPLVFLDEE